MTTVDGERLGTEGFKWEESGQGKINENYVKMPEGNLLLCTVVGERKKKGPIHFPY